MKVIYSKKTKVFSKEEVLEEAEWKPYKKTANIWVISLEDAKNQDIVDKNNNVDTLEGTQKVNKSDIICKGQDGEIWNQPKSRLEEKYTKIKDDAEWSEWKPKGEKVEAFKFEKGNFKIDSMNGKKGDWVLRDIKDKNDVWIVDNDLFNKTYDNI